MKKRVLGTAVSLALILVPASVRATIAAPQGASDTAPTYLNAVVVSTDPSAATMTVRPKGRASETLRLEGPLAARLGEWKAGDEVIVTLQGGRVLEIKKAVGAAAGATRAPARRRRAAPASPAVPARPATPVRPANPPPGPLTPPGVPRPPTPPAPPTLYPGPPPSPGPLISPTPGPTPTPTANPWRTPPPVPTPRPVPTPKRVFPSPEFTVPPSPGPSPTPTPSRR
jgi:hypothetical protein